jgi:hypothetical protein
MLLSMLLLLPPPPLLLLLHVDFPSSLPPLLLILSSWFRSTSSGRVDFRFGTAPDEDDENAHCTAFNTAVDVTSTDSPARDHSDDPPNTLC